MKKLRVIWKSSCLVFARLSLLKDDWLFLPAILRGEFATLNFLNLSFTASGNFCSGIDKQWWTYHISVFMRVFWGLVPSIFRPYLTFGFPEPGSHQINPPPIYCIINSALEKKGKQSLDKPGTKFWDTTVAKSLQNLVPPFDNFQYR